MTIMTHNLPHNLQRLLQQHGIEGESLTNQDGSLLIEMDDVEVAFQIREATLDFHPCCLIAHPSSKKPSLLIHNLLQ
jgi:hypothetical protein